MDIISEDQDVEKKKWYGGNIPGVDSQTLVDNFECPYSQGAVLSPQLPGVPPWKMERA